MNSPRINRIIKEIALVIFIITVMAVAVAAVARADGILTAEEEAFGDGVAPGLCSALDQYGVNQQSMAIAMKAIYRNTPSYIDMSDSVDIINYAVYNYCPNHWGELVAFGEGARIGG